MPGQRFCKSCGRAIDASTLVVPAEGGFAELERSSVTETKTLDHPSAVSVSDGAGMPVPPRYEFTSNPVNVTGAVEPDSAFGPQVEPATVWTPAWEPVEQKSPASPATGAASDSKLSQSVPSRHLGQKVGLGIGIAAAALAMAGVWAWYSHSHRSVSSTPEVTSESQRVNATPPEQPSRPTPSILGPPASSTQPSQPRSSTFPPPAPLLTKVTRDSGQDLAIKTPRPDAESPQPQLPPATAAPRSGLLHYQGPPVPYNGTVVFDHLPHARLKFNFDRQAWTLIIKPNLDGTKRVTLISQKQGYQTNCDLSWEVAE